MLDGGGGRRLPNITEGNVFDREPTNHVLVIYHSTVRLEWIKRGGKRLERNGLREEGRDWKGMD
jgi:hypothetical protein